MVLRMSRRLIGLFIVNKSSERVFIFAPRAAPIAALAVTIPQTASDALAQLSTKENQLDLRDTGNAANHPTCPFLPSHKDSLPG
jgi:hypothetical protein